MKVLVTEDFYTNFEMYETEKPNVVRNCVAFQLLGDDIHPSPEVAKLIGNSDDMTTEEAVDQADQIIYVSELMEILGIE